jgi:carboxyl-terminal processing protease
MLAVSVAFGILMGFKLNEKPENGLIYTSTDSSASHAPVGRIEELIRFIENKYVEKVESEVLITDAIEAVFAHLDPHSVYLTPEEVRTVADQMEGSYAGLGVENFMIDDTVNVASVLPDSPAAKSGILVFDQLLAIDGKSIAGAHLPHDEVRNMLRKEPGTKVTVEVLRNKKKHQLQVVVDEVPVKSVHAFSLQNIQAVYVKIDHFGATTYREFMDVVETSIGNGKAKHLILDLRDNPGGYLPEATNILCQIFTEKDRLLLYTEGRNDKRNEYKSNGKQFFQIEKVAVLMNEHSASASEIIAGAIQDWDRGVIIGRRSYGKGLVQEQYPLSNGGAIRLTVSRYYTPSGRSIQRDYSDRVDWENDFDERLKNDGLFVRDRDGEAEETHYATLVKKRKVKGGGGIYPDIFIPLDSVFTYEHAFYVKDRLPEFAFRYMRKYRHLLPTTAASFGQWQITPHVESNLRAFYNNQNEEDCILLPDQLSGFHHAIKEQLGKWLFGEAHAIRALQEGDPFFKMAAMTLQQSKELPSQ